MSNEKRMLRCFVYGTLKRGYWNHLPFCQGVVSIEPAMVRGRLYQLSSGIPMLQVPQDDIVAIGTADPLADTDMQEQITRLGLPELAPDQSGDGWRYISGELMTFNDPEMRLPQLDRLEGFNPSGRCLYHRVLVPVQLVRSGTLLAWCYVAGPSDVRFLTPTGKTQWP